MPFTGGLSPGPERYGGGELGSDAPRLQRIFESIAAARGSAYDQTLNSVVGVENLALARAICFDLFGANERLANQFYPATMTADGLLPRWEKILGLNVLSTDTEPVRRGRVAAAFARIGQPNSAQPMIDALAAALGPVYVGVNFQSPGTALEWWPGLSGSAAKVTATSSPSVTLQGLFGVQTAWYGQRLTLANCTNAANNGTFPITSTTPSSGQVVATNASAVSPDYGIGGSSGAPTIQWQVTRAPTPSGQYDVPWYSTIAHVDIQVQQPAAYTLAQFYAAVANIGPLMDDLMPAWTTWDWWIASSHGGLGFYLDENNLDLEAFDV